MGQKIREYVRKNAPTWSHSSPHRHKKASPHEARILDLIASENPATSTIIAEKLGLPVTTIRPALHRLKERQKIKLVRRWEIIDSAQAETV